MKGIALIVCVCLVFSAVMFGATEFVSVIKQNAASDVDFTSLVDWQSCIHCNLTASKVFSVTSESEPGIQSNRKVFGETSNSTGTVVHVSSAGTQVLIKSITGTFQSGEKIFEDGSGGWARYAFLGDSGDSPIAVAKIDGAWTAPDTNRLTFSGWTTSADNYIRIYTSAEARHVGHWDTTTKYRISVSEGSQGAINWWWWSYTAHVKIDGLQIENTADATGSNNPIGIYDNFDSPASGALCMHEISNCIFKWTGGGTPDGWYNAAVALGVSTGTVKIWNNISIDFPVFVFGDGSSWAANRDIYCVYNNTVVNPGKPGSHFNGIYMLSSGDYDSIKVYLKNNVVQRTGTSGTCYSLQTFNTYVYENNISNDATSPNAAYQNKTVSFQDGNAGYFLLSSTDTEAVDKGVDLSADTKLAFTSDILGTTRPYGSSWDIGANEMVPPDTTPPITPAAVRDGTGADISSTTLLNQLSANWDASTDAESGISGYKYAIGTVPGGTNTTNWTLLSGTGTEVTKTGLTLTVGTAYYFTVKALNGYAIEGSTAVSDGQLVIDVTAPSTPPAVRDGTGADISSMTSSTQLSANWDTATDTESGIAKYLYAIGTTPGNTDTTLDWLDNGVASTVTKTGLSLTVGVTYYFTVKSQNGAGLQSSAANSDGQYAISVDTSPPGAPAAVRDGTGTTDASFTYSTTTLSANWDAAIDSESGISGYRYAIGTSPAGTELVDWTDNSTNLNVTRTGLTLTVGATYYFSVKAENGVGLQGTATNSDGQYAISVDTSPPGAPAAVRDGTGTTDASFTYSTTTLSANWDAAIDSESGISGYRYAIGTSPAGTDLADWTALGNVLTVTQTGLSLTEGTTCYFSVKAVNGVFLESSVTNSDGQVVLQATDTTPPGVPGTVRDGTGADISSTTSTTQLSANWDVAIDTESGIARYWYAISSNVVGSSWFVGWTDNGISTSVTKTGLTLRIGSTYYFSVKAEDGAGAQGNAANSNGQVIVLPPPPPDTTPPGAPAQIRDGTSFDINGTTLTTQLSANWNAATDAQSGIAKYWYAIGTTAGGTDVVNWTDNSTSTSVTKAGLTLIADEIYYFSVKAQNGAGLQGPAANSDGQLAIGTTPPPPPPALGDQPVYPNPHNFTNGQPMTFKITGGAGGTVKIYTLDGLLVRTLSAGSGTDTITWDGKNDSGQDVKSGVYIYTIAGSTKAKGKLLIIREK